MSFFCSLPPLPSLTGLQGRVIGLHGTSDVIDGLCRKKKMGETAVKQHTKGEVVPPTLGVFFWDGCVFILILYGQSRWHNLFAEDVFSIYIMMSVELSNKVITKTWPQEASNGGWIMMNNTRWWFQPIRKILVKLDHFPRDPGENKQYLKQTT